MEKTNYQLMLDIVNDPKKLAELFPDPKDRRRAKRMIKKYEHTYQSLTEWATDTSIR